MPDSSITPDAILLTNSNRLGDRSGLRGPLANPDQTWCGPGGRPAPAEAFCAAHQGVGGTEPHAGLTESPAAQPRTCEGRETARLLGAGPRVHAARPEQRGQGAPERDPQFLWRFCQKRAITNSVPFQLKDRRRCFDWMDYPLTSMETLLTRHDGAGEVAR